MLTKIIKKSFKTVWVEHPCTWEGNTTSNDEQISQIQECMDAFTSAHFPPSSMCVRKLACPTHLWDRKQPLIFHSAQSTERAEIQYKEMLYLFLHRLIIRQNQKHQGVMASCEEMTCRHFWTLLFLFTVWDTWSE